MNTKYHTFWRRLFAGILDGLIFLPLGFAGNVIIAYHPIRSFIIAWLFVNIFSRPVYTILMHGRYGQTIGKMATGIIIVHVSEDRVINYKEAVIRESPNWIVSAFYFMMTVYLQFVPDAFASHSFIVVYGVFGSANLIWFLLEIITMLTNNKRRALHDYLAHSVIIRKEFLIPQVPLLEMEEEAA